MMGSKIEASVAQIRQKIKTLLQESWKEGSRI
jgi:hypothetical protein